MAKTVDSYHFIGGMTKRLVKSGIRMESPPIVSHPKRHPWHLPKLLSRQVPKSAG